MRRNKGVELAVCSLNMEVADAPSQRQAVGMARE